MRYVEFFTTQVSHARKAYLNATRRFEAWCLSRGIQQLAAVEPFHSPRSASCRHRDADRQSYLPRDGITAYMKNKGLLERAQTLANHASLARPSSMIGGRTKSRWTRSRRFRSKGFPAPQTYNHATGLHGYD
jgi:hypothetical protein